jgi:hypothetical protein
MATDIKVLEASPFSAPGKRGGLDLDYRFLGIWNFPHDDKTTYRAQSRETCTFRNSFHAISLGGSRADKIISTIDS